MTTINIGPPKVDLLRVRAGDRNLFNLRLTENGVPLVLTGLTFEAQARVTATSPDPAITADVTVPDPDDNLIEIRWPGADVRTLLGTAAKWTGVWDLQMSDGVSDPQTLMAGKFTAEEDVTR